MTTQRDLFDKLRTALANDSGLADTVIRELSDKNRILEQLEDAVSEKIELARKLESLSDLQTRYEQLQAQTRQLEKQLAGATDKPRPTQAPIFDPTLSDEIEKLRNAKQDLEQELALRDEIIAGLREDFQKLGSGPSDIDSLTAERDSLIEQLSLALSQLEECTDKDKTRARLIKMEELAHELESKLEAQIRDNQRLLARAEQAEERCQDLETRIKTLPDEVEHHGNPLLIWVVGGLLGVAIYVAYCITHPVTSRPAHARASLANATQSISTKQFERLARLRLLRQEDSWTRIARSDTELGKIDEDRLREALDRAAKGKDTYRRALAHLIRGSFADSIGDLEAEFAKRAKERALTAYLAGRAMFFAGQADQAAAMLKSAVGLDASLSDAWRALGDIHNLAGRTDKALECYQAAVKANPDDAAAYAAIGAIYNFQDESDKALEALQKAVAVDPGLSDAHYTLGLIWQRQEDWDRAARAFKNTVLHCPKHGAAHYYLGRCYQILGRSEKAKDHFEQAKALGYTAHPVAPTVLTTQPPDAVPASGTLPAPGDVPTPGDVSAAGAVPASGAVSSPGPR